MYAQCPECLTFFHLKPSHLKAASGRVRCSRCKHVFNALETLRDELTADEVEAVKAARRREPKPDAPLLNEEYAGDLFDGLEYTENAELGLDAPETGDMDANDARPVPEREVQADALASPAREFHDFQPTRTGTRHPVLFALANIVFALALLVQLAHWQRQKILTHPVAGPYLARVYEIVGFEPQPPRDLAALNVSRTEVSSHPDHPRALHLTALLHNDGKNAQPWPDLRVDLQDRWGETVGARYFTPAEYLREPAAAEQLLPPRGRFPIALAIIDPGSDAVGFQVEPCFASGNDRHVCPSHIGDEK